MIAASHRFAILISLVGFFAASSAEAACSGGKCRNAVWSPGAKTTSFGGIAGNAHLTPYGVTNGHATPYGVTTGHKTAYGVTSGKQTSYGVSAGHSTSYGVSGGHSTSYGVTSGVATGTGVMGAGCRKTAWGVNCSDMRLKRDISPVGRLDNGLTLYKFRYLWSSSVFVGVMAQDVMTIAPDAVTRGADGYLRVDYSKVGAPMRSWDEWRRDSAVGL